MKALLILLFTTLTTIAVANEIDKLQTPADVNQFIAEKIDKRYVSEPQLFEATSEYNKEIFGKNKFYKLDINTDGFTDLIIDGRNFYVIVDNGNQKYMLNYFPEIELIAIDSISTVKKLIVYPTEKPTKQIDTLIYKFNGFLEENTKPLTTLKFEKIDFGSLSNWVGEESSFNMIISKDRTAVLQPDIFLKKEKRQKCIIPQEEFDEMISILKYLNISQLKSYYRVRGSDYLDIKIKFAYNNKSKFIHDYGMIGTFGLNLLYKKIFNWRDKLDWKEL